MITLGGLLTVSCVFVSGTSVAVSSATKLGLFNVQCRTARPKPSLCAAI